MLDNMDGVTASVSACILIAAVVLILSDSSVSNAYLIIIIGLLGAIIGFLFFNWHPSRMYMGDTGSQFLGIFLAGISILLFWNYRQDNQSLFDFRQLLLPMLIFIVPLIDTATVVIRRLLKRRSPFVGGKDHTTHHLAYIGIPEGTVVIILVAISLISLALVFYMFRKFDSWENIYTIAGFAYFAFVFAIMQVLYNLGKKRHIERLKAHKKKIHSD
jgi:UDP-GlcNAc:undecaprenyl-phosphate GlcNAc-1-phosphate transferase